jgi:5-methylcytosine-specific restriction endonuclease McrA
MSFDRKEYGRVWIANRRKEFFKDKKCENCGSTENLEPHHINPELKKDHKIWSWSEKRRNEELKKCKILCQSCHKIETKEWYKKNRKHGRSWYNHGCRCPICFSAQQEHNRQRRKKPD